MKRKSTTRSRFLYRSEILKAAELACIFADGYVSDAQAAEAGLGLNNRHENEHILFQEGFKLGYERKILKMTTDLNVCKK